MSIVGVTNSQYSFASVQKRPKDLVSNNFFSAAEIVLSLDQTRVMSIRSVLTLWTVLGQIGGISGGGFRVF